MGKLIRIRGARQHNLKNLNLDIKTGEITVFTGVSGSGKSSLVFDTLYAEGQRRYVETFSPYARQFLDRMDKPDVDSIDGVLPAIAIDQANPVRTSRSTVGTMTEINDHLKLIYARAAHLHCRQCGQWVREDTPASIQSTLRERAAAQNDPRVVITFPVTVPLTLSEQDVEDFLSAQGYTRVHRETLVQLADAVVDPKKDSKKTSKPKGAKSKKTVASNAPTHKILDVVQDRFRVGNTEESRLSDAIASALHRGKGKVNIFALPDDDGEAAAPWRFSEGLHCATCDIDYAKPLPSHFSFNSPLGACETCRGFGRVIGIDYGLVIPDENKSLAEGCVKPWQTESFKPCQKDLVKYAKQRGIATDIAFKHLPEEHQLWVIEGDANFDGNWDGPLFYGVARFFEWLETRTYKMHVRVMLSKYRSYTPCTACNGARLKPDSLLWKLPHADARHNIHDIMMMPLVKVAQLFANLQLPGALDEASDLVLQEIRTRLQFLIQVGLGYLTLDRQSRTLSGGEVQRINLTTALGSSLVNTLFVLDEPSVGLHPRDIARVATAMQRLKEAGNTLVVVEHDPQLMNQADRLIDIGPGPGEAGGQIVFDGAPAAIETADSLTARYLKGDLKVVAPTDKALGDGAQHLLLSGVRANNLKNIDFKLPLNRLVVLTGVSGSGKSTLVQDVLVPALKKIKGEPTEAPGEFDSLDGAELIGQLAFVDQSPIGKTTRSNPASYVGAFDELRKIFSKTTVAVERGYTPGFFSFNSGDGRCPMCGGNGFEHVEMQFLSDVYLRCGECNGTRYRPEALEVTIERKGQVLNMHQVLELTVDQALHLFDHDSALRKTLQPLAEVGLNYLRLGQPVPTLSGGEAQRLKLAGFLAELKPTVSGQKVAKRGDLFVFDEPTTGLHFDDVAKLMKSLRLLQQAGHSVLVVEHNLDVICAADWLIDLGPEAGEFGGELVAQGTPDALAKHKHSHTGVAIAQYRKQRNLLKAADLNAGEHAGSAREPDALYEVSTTRRASTDGIEILHAREHNLKNISLTIPREQMTVITGPSGSGKSTLAFDILFSEGQRRYLESLNAYARQFVQPAAKPEVDAIFGIPPTVAIEQRTSRGGRKSTVATVTEVYHFLRLLFVKLGIQHCPTCEVPIAPQSMDSMLAQIMQAYKGKEITLLAPLVQGRKGIYNEIAKWAVDRGYERLRVDGAYVPTNPWPKLARYQEHHIEVPVDTLTVNAKGEKKLREVLARALEFGKGTVMVESTSSGREPESTIQFFSTKRACPSCARSFPELDPRLFSYNSKHGWCPSCFGVGEKVDGFDADTTGEEGRWLAEQDRSEQDDETDDAGYLGSGLVCGQCDGQRLNATALAVKFKGQSIAELADQTVTDALHWVEALKLDAREETIAKDIRIEMAGRLKFLKQVGLDYLHLNRSAPTLSGGEAQRIRLASQLGTNLRGVCYVLDEPTIGLHTRDNHRLLDALDELRSKGNTLVVVEHDIDTMLRADRLVDIGPGAGKLGGAIMSQGSVAEVRDDPNSLTGRYLKQPIPHLLQPRRPVDKTTQQLRIRNATLHNIQGLDVDIPLGRLVAVTGVSGSGKSTLARDILLANMRQAVATQSKRGGVHSNWFACDAIDNAPAVARVLEVDQTPIGKTPRSCPATYIGFWNRIRTVMADTAEARLRGFEASRFSFNTGPGRCPVCEGQGMQTIEMNFLPDVKVLCEACRGARFNPDTLQVTWRDKTAADILNMSVEEAAPFFTAHPSIAQPLQLLADVGLGYLTLGQPSPTLSGGEAQRIKLVTELTKVRDNRVNPHTLYVLDEPTVGLHMNDVEKLIAVLHRLVDAGHTVVVIEHDLDLIAQADWVIDMGPEAGVGGGQLVAQGSPQHVAAGKGMGKGKKPRYTAKALADFYASRGG
ncbi:MAG TPA: excinuclease ABC subunit UvrA [Limnobacter sp.]|uniref:excinuclease ABC subunit UvrA n=1 Tax=Limnobacter sp. TaxID=2003368 RepID=UPI002ED9628C